MQVQEGRVTMTTSLHEKTFDFVVEKAELRAMFYGFNDAAELKEWAKQMDRQRLAELSSQKVSK